MGSTENALQGVKSRIADAARTAHRDPREIVLVAVSKTQSAGAIREAYAAGQRDFGENYVQEALDKMDSLADLAMPPHSFPSQSIPQHSIPQHSIPQQSIPSHSIIWHFIGPIQSNKTRAIAERFDWVHSVDRLKIAERLSAQRPSHRGPLQLCVQVNVSGELSKSGCAPDELAALAHGIAGLPNLQLRGLMAVPEPTSDAALQRRRFDTLRELRDALNASGLSLDTLSMGMSADMQEAIAAGSTMVRIGTAIFGARA